MGPAAANKTWIAYGGILVPCAKALAVSCAMMFSLTQQSFGADCSKIPETLARLRCFNQAADARLPMPKGAKTGQKSREDRVRKFGGQVAK